MVWSPLRAAEQLLGSTARLPAPRAGYPPSSAELELPRLKPRQTSENRSARSTKSGGRMNRPPDSND